MRRLRNGGGLGAFMCITLRIQVCPKKGISPTISLQSYSGDGVETINPTNFREGSGFLGLQVTSITGAPPKEGL